MVFCHVLSAMKPSVTLSAVEEAAEKWILCGMIHRLLGILRFVCLSDTTLGFPITDKCCIYTGSSCVLGYLAPVWGWEASQVGLSGAPIIYVWNVSSLKTWNFLEILLVYL